MMTLEQIKAAVEAGKTVYWSNEGYTVIKDSIGQWLIKCSYNDHYIGLTWNDGVTMNGNPEAFYMGGMPQPEPWNVRMDREIAAPKTQTEYFADAHAFVKAERSAKAVAVATTTGYTGQPIDPAAVLADAHAFVKAERAAKYVRWAKEFVGGAMGNDHETAETIRECAASHLADKLAISDGLTLTQVGEAHTTLAEKLVAEIPLYAAGWTGSDTQYFDDANMARRYIAQGLERAADTPVDGVSPSDVLKRCEHVAECIRAIVGDGSNNVTLFGVTYFVNKV